MRTCLRALSLCLAAMIALVALPGTALAVSQRSVELDAKLVEIDLAAGNTHPLNGVVLPSGASQKIVWSSSNRAVASVSSAGLITAYRIGRATVSARPATRSAWTRATVVVTDSLSPSAISLNAYSLNLRVGGTFQLTSTVAPDSAIQTLAFTTTKGSVAQVSADGLITARKAGTAIIRAVSTRNGAIRRSVVVRVKNLPLPTRLTIPPSATTIERGETLQLSDTVSPASANPSVAWASSDRSVATVDQDGLVTTKKVGSARIRVRSKVRPSVYATRTIKVVDTKTVTGVVIDAGDSVLLEGGRVTFFARVLPDTASQAVTWESDNPAVADVSDGVVTGYSQGTATITVTADQKTTQQRVVVLDATPVRELPEQITAVSGIRENLAKIAAVKDYAVGQVDALRLTGAISSTEATSRKKILLRAFDMASIPWMSSRAVLYWSDHNKRYLKNVVYYGLPYTQYNRTFNVAKAVSKRYFVKQSGNSYYNAYLKDRYYPGNDCSSFVSMSYWGLGTSRSYLRSDDMKISSAYKTVATKAKSGGYLNLRPGDMFIRNGHVAMFLYYTNSVRNQVMIIQQGGLDYLNTVACTIKPLSFYSADSHYVARRLKGFA